MKNRSSCGNMIKYQLVARGIIDEKVLKAFSSVPRHLFVPDEIRYLAYNDSPLSIGEGQTISQPYIVALMMQILELKESDKVLEIGTGSGYQTALLAEIATEVFTVERINSLIQKAENLLNDLGYKNIFYRFGDGTLGWKDGNPEQNKFDKIIVAAAAPDIPESLTSQLAMNGKLIIPTGNRTFQQLVVITRTEDGYIHTNEGGCTFVPLIGDEGWQE
ncbi:MAG: protein-L-isoaspartate(D-aspartate) O-methyltransferase [Candidatus Cloacimonetes bacterium]|jgi:protein-L-isoaspartate(D-aspartate) O-methyltransferase|nr:protein-L-isoaspartate(D-aspartate) O-methyltransferase [Candidatus Cloacimonadota bacterium]